MERDFESYLAKNIARKKGRRPFAKLCVVSAAFVTVGVLMGIAALSFAWSGEPGRPDFIQSETVFDHVGDEVLSDDGTVDARRVMTLKAKTADVPGELHDDYTKLTYRVNVSVNGDYVEELAAGSMVGLLELSLGVDVAGTISGTYEVYDSSADVTVTGSLIDPTIVAFYVGSSASVSAMVPSIDGFEAGAGDWMSLTISIDFADPFVPGNVVETPWPGLGLATYSGDF